VERSVKYFVNFLVANILKRWLTASPMKGGKLLTTVLNYERCAMHDVLDVIGLPQGGIIGSFIEV
jgi:hypothetical protein